jgi:hypothetical protein
MRSIERRIAAIEAKIAPAVPCQNPAYYPLPIMLSTERDTLPEWKPCRCRLCQDGVPNAIIVHIPDSVREDLPGRE